MNPHSGAQISTKRTLAGARLRSQAWIPALVLGVAVRVLLYPAFHGQGRSWVWLPILEGLEYLKRSASGWGTIFSPPEPPLGSYLYPGLLRLLGVEERGDLSVLFFFQHILGLVSLLLLYLLMRRFARRWIAGAITALWSLVPIFPYWEHQVSPASVTVFAALSLALMLTSSKPNALAAGVVGGVSAMLTPVWTWPLILALAAAFLWNGGRRRRRVAAIAATAFLVTATPMLRCGLRAHFPPVLTWESGIDAYIGHGPRATGTFRSEGHLRWMSYSDFLSELNDTQGRQLPHAEAGRLWQARARSEAFSNPSRTLGLELRKVALAFSPHESPKIRSPQYALRAVNPAVAALLVLEWILVPLGLAGLIVVAPRHKGLALLAAALLLPLILRYVSSSGRLPLLALTAAGGAVSMETLLTARRRDRIGIVAIAAAALALFGFAMHPAGVNDRSEEMRIASSLSNQAGNRPLAIERGQQAVNLDPTNIAARINFATLLAADGVFPKAAEQLGAAVDLDSTYAPALLGLAEMRQRLADHAAAVRLYRSAAELRPKNPQIWNDLGGAYLQMSSLDSALACFKRALEIFPGYETARSNLATVQGAIAANATLLDVVAPPRLGSQERMAFAEALRALDNGDEAAARRFLESLQRGAADDLRRPYLSAMIALHNARNREAAQQLEECYRAAPGNALIAFQLAQAERQTGRLDLAIAVLEDAVRAHPQEASLVQLLQQYRAESQ